MLVKPEMELTFTHTSWFTAGAVASEMSRAKIPPDPPPPPPAPMVITAGCTVLFTGTLLRFLSATSWYTKRILVEASRFAAVKQSSNTVVPSAKVTPVAWLSIQDTLKVPLGLLFIDPELKPVRLKFLASLKVRRVESNLTKNCSTTMSTNPATLTCAQISPPFWTVALAMEKEKPMSDSSAGTISMGKSLSPPVVGELLENALNGVNMASNIKAIDPIFTPRSRCVIIGFIFVGIWDKVS